MPISTIGLDLAKSIFRVHGVGAGGAVMVRKKLRRAEVLTFFEALEPGRVGMEARATAHFWAWEIAALGHDVRVMSPLYAKAYVRRQKNAPRTPRRSARPADFSAAPTGREDDRPPAVYHPD